MATLEQGDRQFKHASLSAVECEFLFAFWHWAYGIKSLLIIGSFDGLPLNDNPGSTAGTCHTRAQNAIRHLGIIRAIEVEGGPHASKLDFLLLFDGHRISYLEKPR